MVIKSILGCRLVVDDRVNRDVDAVDAVAMREGKRGRRGAELNYKKKYKITEVKDSY